MAALEVLKEEDMAANAAILGPYFREQLKKRNLPFVKDIRGKGLLNAIELDHNDEQAAWKLCLQLKENGLLAKQTHGDKIRFAPPLVITKEQVDECVAIIAKSFSCFEE
jgi:ornithine--oxo-acid transaminase